MAKKILLRRTFFSAGFRKELISLLFVFGSSLFTTSNAQIIGTYAGNGVAGSSGDGGPATAAELNMPTGGVAQDAAGNLYIAVKNTDRIRVVNSAGTISTYAGNGAGGFSGDGGQATAAELSAPYDVAADASGNIYIADASNNRIRKINTSGIISTIAGNGISGYTGNGGQATAAEIANPLGVAVDASGNVYVAEQGMGSIREINTSGIISTVAGNGIQGYSGDGGQATAAEVNQPYALTIDALGNIYIADEANHRVREVNTSGIITTIAGNGVTGNTGNGGQATAAEIGSPTGVAVDASGNIYIADATEDNIRKVNTSGVISKIAGYATAGYSGDGGQATMAEINTPHNLAFDNYGNLYVADDGNNRIRVIYLVLNVSVSVTTNVGCNGGSNGSTSATVSNGTIPYTYSWSGGGTSSTYTGLTVGTYTITVTDADGVTGSSTVTITQPTALNVSINSPFNITCFGGNNGYLSTTISGGTLPYTYAWSNGKTTSFTGTLTAGTYTVIVTDNNSCAATASATVTQPTALSVSATAANSSICYGLSDSLKATVSGGTSPYTYSWSPTTGLSCSNCQKPVATPTATTTYTITTTDSHGCASTASVNVTVNPLPNTIITSSQGNSIYIGTIDTLAATGAATYLWSTGTINNKMIVAPSVTTTYFITGTSAAGCNSNVTYTLHVRPLPLCNFIDSQNVYQVPYRYLTNLATCGTYTVKYTLVNPSDSVKCPFSFTISLPDSIYSHGSGFTYTSSDSANITPNFTNIYQPVLTVLSTTSGYWNKRDTINFTFSITTPCCQPSNNSQRTHISDSICNDSTLTPLTVVAPILYANCVYPEPAHIDHQNVGDVVDVVFKITNGTPSLPINQYVNVSCPSVSYLNMLGYFFSATKSKSIDSLNTTYCHYDTTANFVRGSTTLIQANTVTYNSLFSTSYFPVDSIFYVHILYQVTGCNPLSGGDSLNFVLYCSDGGSHPTCNPGTDVATYINVEAGTPHIFASMIPPVYFDSTNANYCNGGVDAVRLGFIYTNNGVDIPGGAHGNAIADSIKLYFETIRELGSIDIDSFRLNNVLIPSSLITVAFTNSFRIIYELDLSKLNYYCTSPYGNNTIADLDDKGGLDDLSNLSGQNTFTVTVDFQYANSCPASFSSCGGNGNGDTPLSTFIGYLDQCDNTVTGATFGPDLGEYGYNYLVNPGGYSELNTLSGHDILWDAPFYVELCPEQNVQGWSDTSYHFICKHPDERIVFNLPSGYVINFSDTTIFNSNHTLKQNVILTTACGFCPSDTIHPLVTFDSGCSSSIAIVELGLLPTCNCSSNYQESYNVSCVILPLSLKCNSCTSSSGLGWDILSYSLDYYCDTSTCTACPSVITCASNEAIHHCEGNCNPIGNDLKTYPPFTFRRQTLGWLDTIPANYYNACTNPPKVNVDSVARYDTAIRLDRAYPGDVILAADSGTLDNSFSNYDSIIFQVNYNVSRWRSGSFADTSIFDFDNSLSEITVIDSNHTTVTISAPNLQHPYDRISSDGTVQMSFTFSASDPALSGMVAPYSLVARIFLIAKTAPLTHENPIPTFFYTGQYPLVPIACFRANYDTNALDTDNSCDPWTAEFTMLQPGVSVGVNDPTITYCGEYLENLTLTTMPALWPQDDFPYEYRPYASLNNNSTVIFPSGFTYDSAQFVVILPKYDLTGPNHFVVNDSIVQNAYSLHPVVIGNTVSFSQCLPLLDCKAFHNWDLPYYSYLMYFTPSCNAPDTGYFKAYTGYTTSIQQSNTMYQPHSNDTLETEVIFQAPSLSLSKTTTTNMCSDSVRFLITLTNNSTFTAPFPWISLEQTDRVNPPVIFQTVYNASYYDMYGDSNIFAMLPPLLSGQTDSLIITALVDTLHGNGCVSSQTNYPITIAYGNECNNTPALTQPNSNACKEDSSTYTFNLYPSSLSLTQSYTDTTTLRCTSNILFSFKLNNTSQNALNMPSFFLAMPTGVDLDSIKFNVPPNTTFYKDDLGRDTGSLSWNLEKDSVLKQGFTGQCSTLTQDSITVTIYANTVCGFTGLNNNFKVYATGLSPCNQLINSNIINNTLSLPAVNSSCCRPLRCWSYNHYDTVLINTDAKSLYPYFFGWMYKPNVLIEGTFTVDTDFNFYMATVSMAPNAIINVVNNSTLSSQVGGYFHAACDSMWRGIFVYPGSTLVTNDETIIQDADTAIYAMNNGSVQGLYLCNITVFNKNYKDIVVQPCPGTYGGRSWGSLYTCRNLDSLMDSTVTYYYSTIRLLSLANWYNTPVSTLLPPHAGEKTYIGWQIDTVGQFTDMYKPMATSTGRNIFDNLNFGIWAQSTNLTICSDTFEDINTNANSTGIVAVGDESSFDYNLTIGGPTFEHLPNYFRNCSIGVLASVGFQDANISCNKMDSLNSNNSYGIIVLGPNPVNSTITIDSNIIDSANIGILCLFAKSGAITIDSNTIEGSNYCGGQTGVSMGEWSTFDPVIYSVKNNNIANASYGVSGSALGNDTISWNKIFLNDTLCATATGIGVYGDVGDQIVGDTISMSNHSNPSDYSGDAFTGIYAEMSTKCFISCNQTNYLTNHLLFNSDQTFNVLDNTMYSGNNTLYSTGIELLDSTTALGNQGNPDTSSDNMWHGTFYCKSSAPSPVTPSYSKFYVQTGIYYNPDSGTCSPQLTAISGALPSALSCSTLRMIMDKVLMDTIAKSQISYLQYPSPATRISKQALTTTLWNKQNLLLEPTLYHFNDSISATSLGQLMVIDSSISSSQAIDPSTLLTNATAITPSSNIEANMQTTAQIHLQARIAKTRKLSTQQTNSLTTIANLCPFTDGIGVYQARNLLAYYNGAYNIYNATNCNRSRDELHKPTKKNVDSTKTISFNLYPNPNNGTFTIDYDLGSETTGRVEIYSEVGMNIGEYLLNSQSGTMVISNSKLSEGVYFYKVYTQTGIKKVGKIVVIR